MARIRSHRVCFTVNNYSLEDVDNFVKYCEGNEKVLYAVAGLEIGEQGTPHIQGYIHLDMDPQKGGIKFWKSELPFKSAHFSTARGTDIQNQAYCTKDGPFFEHGTPAEDKGNVWERLVRAAKVSMEEAEQVSAELFVRHYHQLESINAAYNKPIPKVNIEELRPWQATAIQKLEAQPDRKVLFVVDEEGGKGKSELTKYLMANKEAWACQGE